MFVLANSYQHTRKLHRGNSHPEKHIVNTHIPQHIGSEASKYENRGSEERRQKRRKGLFKTKYV